MKAERCPVCDKGSLRAAKHDFAMYGVSLGKFPAQVCDACGEAVFSEAVSRRIQQVAKKRGLWGIAKKVKVTYSGNGLTIHVPKALAAFLQLQRGDEVVLRPEGRDRIVIDLDEGAAEA